MFKNFPVCAAVAGYALGSSTAANRHHALAEIEGCLAARVQRMGGNNSQRAAGADPNSRDGAPGDAPVPNAKTSRRPNPAKTGFEDPSAEVIRQPTPRLVADKRPAEERIEIPIAVAVIERRPSEANAIGPPTVTVAGNGIPRAVGVEITEAGRIIGRAGVLHRGSRGRHDAVFAAGDPVVKIVVFGKPANVDGRVFAGTHGERLAFFERGGVVLVSNVDVALEDVDVAAVIEIVHAEASAAGGFDSEIATGDAEVVAAAGIDVERCRALAKNQARRARAVIQRKIVELKDRVFTQEGHGAIFKFNFSAALVRGNDVALANGKIEHGGLPDGFLVGEGVAVGIAREAHIALNEAEADNAGVARIGDRRMRAGE